MVVVVSEPFLWSVRGMYYAHPKNLPPPPSEFLKNSSLFLPTFLAVIMAYIKQGT